MDRLYANDGHERKVNENCEMLGIEEMYQLQII